MQRTGIARLPLHWGKAPRWLTIRMQRLAKEMMTIIVDEYGTKNLLKRMSDPFWFQALGCVLGYDWHSSGVTTVVTGTLKEVLNPEEHGLVVCGGKGKVSRQTPNEIVNAGEKFGLTSRNIADLQYASKMSAKVDNTAIQAGYQLYHHAFFLSADGDWAVIQQGMSIQDHTARRYHWLSENTKNFIVEPHNAIVGDVKRELALNMTAKESEGCRKASVDVAKEPTEKIRLRVIPAKLEHQKLLSEWIPKPVSNLTGTNEIGMLSMPRSINWKALKKVYEFQPSNYEELLSFKGVGPSTIRGLALIADLINGEKPSWKDPVKYSFAYGGKDGVPYPVDRKAMDQSIEILKRAIQEAKLSSKEKAYSLQKLRQFSPRCY